MVDLICFHHGGRKPRRGPGQQGRIEESVAEVTYCFSQRITGTGTPNVNIAIATALLKLSLLLSVSQK